jgi:SAM-dependent methyltransferase
MTMVDYIYKPTVFKKFANKISRLILIASLQKKYYRNPNILKSFFTSFLIENATVALDIGSGPEPKNPFNATEVYGADLRVNERKKVIFADLSSGTLPFESEKFDYVTAHDLLEHIARVSLVNGETKFPFVNLINEIFRVLKPGGVFFNIQPCFPSKEAFQDPTHINIMTEDTINYYFCQPAWARIYGFEGSFEMINEGWLGGKYFSFIKKTLSEPINNLGFIQK